MITWNNTTFMYSKWTDILIRMNTNLLGFLEKEALLIAAELIVSKQLGTYLDWPFEGRQGTCFRA